MKGENMKYFLIIVLLIAVIFWSGCAGEKRESHYKNDRDEAACIASSGKMVPSSTTGGRDMTCYHAPKDSGKPCTDN